MAATLGVALSGGTAKSVTHVGVLKALAEAGIPISCIAGTSGGSMVAAMYASGMPMSTMEGVAMRMSWRKLISIKVTRLGFISSEPIESFMREAIGDVTFEDFKIPAAVIATDLVTGERIVFRSGPVARAVRASCSIPQVYLPVEIGGRHYVDGGLAEYLPVDALEELGAQFLVASHLGPVDLAYRRPRHILQLVLQITSLMARKNYVISEKKADVIIHPNLDGFSSFDFDNAEEMVETGYEAAARMIDDLRRRWRRKSGVWWKLRRALGGGRR